MDRNSTDFILLEACIKIAALQEILVKKGILSEKELSDQMQEISKNLVEKFKQLTPTSIN